MIIAFYNLGLVIYGWLIQLFSLWNPKARALFQGWKLDCGRGRTDIVHRVNGVITTDFELVWIHCASLGEFEMAKPIAAALQAASSQRHVLFSFFSPSGYNHAVLDNNQTKVYLPLDGRDSAKRWHAQWQPQAAIFIRYEFWYHHLKTTLKANIPTFALGVSLRPNHFLFSKLASPWMKILKKIDGIGLINESMTALAQNNGLNNAFVFGDSKFNRAYDRTQQIHTLHPTLTPWLQQKPTLIFGSAWMPEIELLQHFVQTHPDILKSWQILIAPHDVSAEFCGKIKSSLSQLNPQKYSDGITNPSQTQVIILDSIGQLAQCYRYGAVAIIGGAFGKGLHNSIEAVAFGLPVIFGPNYQKFPEAQQFIDAGFGFSVSNTESFSQVLMNLMQQVNIEVDQPDTPRSSPGHPLSTVARDFVATHKADIEKFANLTYPAAKSR